MATGNMFLGQARGSVGDVTFYTSGGRQRSRVRRRVIANPRSPRQLIQRAILSTVMQAYTAGKEIFDHSFEGLSVPNECKLRFQSLNMRLLRQQLAADFANIDDASYNTVAAVVPPRATMPVPNGYIVSEGSLQPKWFNVTTTNVQSFVGFPGPDIPDGVQSATVGDVMSWIGISPGDIFTVVCFIIPQNYDGAVDDPIGYSARFGWLRFEVIGDHVSEPGVVNGSYVGGIMDLICSMTNRLGPVSPEGLVFGDRVLGSLTDLFGVPGFAGSDKSPIGFIYSRKDSPLRSSCTLTLPSGGDYSITARDLIDVWRAGTVQIDAASDLILEGGNV